MGIQGLLPMLKEIQTSTHVREYAGKTLAVDAYVWLHRGAYGCAQELATGKTTLKYVNYAMHRVRMLKHFGVTPFIVFDGGYLPSKQGTEDDRERRRADALAKGNALLAAGNLSQAREEFVKAVDVTPAMAYQLIKALRREGVEYIVAPYEADPQLAYLEREGHVDGIITEDSDLLIFGCKTVLFKMDGEGHCVAIERSRFSQCREYNFSGWSDTEFRQMAILSGCDYLDSVVGLGLKTAYRLLKKYRTPEKVIQFIRLEGNLIVPKDYLDHFKRAELTFMHQRVFCPSSRSLVHFSPLPPHIVDAATELPFVGAPLDEELANKLAEGVIDPITKEPIVDLVPGDAPVYIDTNALERFKRPTPVKNKSSSSAHVAQGKSSILSFLKRGSAAASTSAASTSRLVAPASNAKLSNKHVASTSIGTKVSRFFGGGSSKKGKEQEVARAQSQEDADGDDVMFVEETVGTSVSAKDDIGASDDEAGEEAMRDLEMATCDTEVDRMPIPGSLEEMAPVPPDPSSRMLVLVLSLVKMTSPGSTPSPQEAQTVAAMLVGTSSDAGVSSPPNSTQLQDIEIDDVQPETKLETQPPVKKLDDGCDILSSPVPSPIKPVALEQVRRESVHEVERKFQTERIVITKNFVDMDCVDLSSDPIGASSGAEEHHVDETPRVRKTMTVKTDFKVYEDVKPTISSLKKGKKRSSQESVEEGAEEDSRTAVASAIGSAWRSKYMLSTNRKSIKLDSPTIATPKTGSTTTPRRALPRSLTSRSFLTTSATKTSSSTPKAARRPPLSPRKMNRIETRDDLVSSPPVPKELKTSSSSFELKHNSSSSPITITNPNLLKWRYSGAIVRATSMSSPSQQQENA